ncbi:MAG: hypothetical protein AN484_21370 [Aphanizomenon flos-aquae WA102]|uniref:Uncharacterized protein n=1 Tax=Aphanizomenon flos-aquae WA102 TaxID=1710896 RepID=A0A1B7WVY1_APHFL|nr:MAG: hypothetical protein AN484_21370 [Aphanizomenon flos-aquae WA102]
MRPISVSKNLTAATATTLYTVPTGYYAKCVLIHACNTSPSKHISFSWYDASTATTTLIVSEQVLSARTTLSLISETQYFVMEEGDYLTATSEAGSTFSVLATFEETGLTRQ